MKWLEGKKTYIAAAVLLFVGAGGYFFNVLPEATATILIATGLGFFGLGSKVERYGKLILEGLDDMKKIQADLAAKNKSQAIADARAAASEIGMEVVAGTLSSGANSAK